MGKLGFARIHKFSGILRLCLCLVLVGIIILGAAEGIAAADVAAGLPVIKVFSGDPLTVPDGGNAVYTFEVYDGTKILVIENGVVIDEFNGPPGTTSKGKSTGMTTNQIRTGSMDSYDTILRVSNPNGRQEKKLTIAFATKSKPKATSLIPPVSDNRTGNKNRWGPQTSAPVSLASATASPAYTGSPYVPDYTQCSIECNCLTPDQAAQFGFKQKCSEERCFSDDRQVTSYCYYKTASTGWCCKDGKVTPATEAECKEAGGSYWSADQDEAIKACQSESGWFCSGGKVYQGTLSQAAQAGATWYATQAEATKACEQPVGGCCTARGATAATQSLCSQMGGKYFSSLSEAQRVCSPIGGCCRNGVVTPSTQAQCTQSLTAAGGVWYATEAQANELCQSTGYGCIKNNIVGPMTEAAAKLAGATYWSTDRAQVLERCQPSLGGCCTARGATSATQAQCTQMGGKWTTTLAEAQRACESPLGGCCVSGRGATSATQAQCSQMGGKWTTTLAEAQQACQLTYYCCSNGKVYQSKTPGTGCYTDPALAQQACQRTYWCCRSGQVYQSTTPGDGCYTSQSQAAASCKPVYVPPKTFVPTPIVPTPRTFVPDHK